MELRRKIEEEQEDLKKLQHPPKVNSLATEGTNKGEKINDIIACSSEKSGKNCCHIKGLGAIRAKIGPTSDVDKIFSKMYSQYVLFRNKYS